MKKRMALLLSALLLCLAGCGSKTAAPDASSTPVSSASGVTEVAYINAQGLMDVLPVDDDGNDWFYETYDYRKFQSISGSLFEGRKAEKEAWVQQYDQQRKNGTLDQTYPALVKFLFDLEVPKAEFEAYVAAENARLTQNSHYEYEKYIISQEQVDAIYGGDLAKMRQLLVGENAIYANGELYSPYWFLNHTPQEYRAAGIPVAELEKKVELYHQQYLHSQYRVAYLNIYYQKLQDYKALME